ncbi:MAG: AzlD domain-containing protein [Peptococcaceae bacterium]
MRNDILFIILGMALVTYLTRVGSLIIFRYTGIPAWAEEWLKHVPTAILTALIIPALILPKGHLDLTFGNHYLIAGLVSAFIAYKSHNIIMTIGLGMSTIFCLNLLGI